jgi:hypothetical protein
MRDAQRCENSSADFFARQQGFASAGAMLGAERERERQDARAEALRLFDAEVTRRMEDEMRRPGFGQAVVRERIEDDVRREWGVEVPAVS